MTDTTAEEAYKAASEWLELDQDPVTRMEIEKLVEEEKVSELCNILLKGRLKFGTAGLRSIMRAGYNNMNGLVILQTAQGLCEYVKKTCSADQLSIGIVIGFDGRHNSRKFAELTANVFVNASIKVCLFDEVCPTPWVSFAVKYYRAAAGVMVTASHNPKEDNGYKVYWSNGAQIIKPHDKNIENAILDNLDVDFKLWKTQGIQNHPLVYNGLKEITRKYLNCLRSNVWPDQDKYIARAALKITYSAMHGVGYPYICEAFKHLGLQPVTPVNEQCYPDPDFPTVRFPNPEEPSSLAMSLELAETNKCSLVLANDPDADRLAVAEYQKDKKEWHIFTGNEIGTLLGWWILKCVKKNYPDVDISSIVVLASAVSSKMLKTIALAEGATFMETLTGFKWMGNKAIELQDNDKIPIFAFEEAIGFMCGIHVPDKDGISAAVHISSLCSRLAVKKQTLLGQLNDLYEQYGYHFTDNSYFISHNTQVFKDIINDLRMYNGTSDYPKCLRDWKITNVRDLGLKKDESACVGTGLDTPLSSGEMLTFTFENGLIATIRTSGTEPKIKYYTELCAQPGQGNREEIMDLLDKMVSALTEDFLQPKKYKLIERK